MHGRGVRHHGLYFVAPELQGRRGQEVQVRYMPHDDRSIEVYLDDEYLCTAYPQGQLTDEQLAEFREHAKAETRRLSVARRRAARRTRAELAVLSDGQTTAVESRLIPHAAGADAARRHDDEALSRMASTTALPTGRCATGRCSPTP